MKTLVTQQDRRAVRDLSFCYLCGNEFLADDKTNYDHVPPESVFAKADRQPLKLRTHVTCNHTHHLVDEKIGQLIALRRRAAPRPERRRLRFLHTNAGTALINLDVDAAVWRWICGFHAALYRDPLRFCATGVADLPVLRSLVLPFPKGSQKTRVFEPLQPQHVHFVEAIKANRFRKNLDQIICNNGQLVYECVWDRYDKTELWFCAFALNICDWKDLGAVTPKQARGCAGHYMLETKVAPPGAALAITSSIIFPNFNRLDPFAP